MNLPGDRPSEALHSNQAEQSVLGGLIVEDSSWDDVAEYLEERHFYAPAHQAIYRAMAQLKEDGQPIDVITLSEALTRNGDLKNVGGAAYLAQLVDATPGISNMQSYARIISEKFIMRRLYGAANDIAELVRNPEGAAAREALSEAEKLIFDIAVNEDVDEGGLKSTQKAMSRVVERIQKLARDRNPVTGLATGLKDLDRLTSGLQPSELIIVAGRPSMGKTAFTLNVAEHVVLTLKKTVAFFSLEMPAEQLILRLISSFGHIDSHKLRTGTLVGNDMNKCITAVTHLKQNDNLYIDDGSSLSPMEMRARLRRLCRRKPVDLVVVDYLQLMRGSAARNENRTAEISEISRSLKAIAREFEVPVIALSQLNRGLASRTDKRPVMSDLRESGAIEQDADVIMFVHREEVYSKDPNDAGKAELIIAKQRNGPIGDVRLTFRHQFTRFEDFADDQVFDEYQQ